MTNRRRRTDTGCFLNGTIAEESWFDDDVTPQLFREADPAAVTPCGLTLVAVTVAAPNLQ